MTLHIIAILTMALGIEGAIAQNWVIDSQRMVYASDVLGDARFVLKGDGGRTLVKHLQMPMRRISDVWVYGNRLAVIADAGDVSTVGILDIRANDKPIWFYCYEPKNVFNRWVVYTEWYPNHMSGNSMDVLLAYDLRASRASNELIGGNFQAKYPFRIGVPLYPASNVLNRTYLNVAPSESQEVHILSSPIGQLKGQRIAFVVEVGSTGPTYTQKVVVVAMPTEPSGRATSAEDILQINGNEIVSGKCCIHVTAISETSSGEIRLSVPFTEYGVYFFDVPVPVFSEKKGR